MAAGTRALIRRLRSDIAERGDEQLFTAVWRQLSPEVERIVDYRPCGQTEPQPPGIAERIDTMPAWQILNVLLYQFDAAKIY